MKQQGFGQDFTKLESFYIQKLVLHINTKRSCLFIMLQEKFELFLLFGSIDSWILLAKPIRAT